MQVVERPRFRQDLIAEAIEDGGKKYIDVGDPDNGQVFRFYEVEFSLACGMDGERDIAGIVQWAKDELGLSTRDAEVRNVIATLGMHGFLDQGAAARAAAPELAQGVVVGQQQRKPAASVDVELGGAGSHAAPAQPLPKSADIDLGAPGVAAAAKAPRVTVEDVQLGAPGARVAPQQPRSEVSIDLADHMGVKPDDVKEAVRQSKQMSAVELPKDLIEQAEAPVPPPKVVPPPRPTPRPMEAQSPPVEAPRPTPAVEKKPEPRPEPKVEAKKPVEKKPEPRIVEKQKAPTAPREGVSPVLIILLILAIGGAGAYFAWRYLLREKVDQTAQVKQPPVTPGSGSVQQPPKPPPAPPAPSAKIAIVPGAERDILSVFPGTVESIDTTERDVESSDVLAKLAGAKRIEAELVGFDKDIERKLGHLKKAQEAREALNPPAPPEGGSGEPPPAPKPVPEAKIKAADAAVDRATTELEKKQNDRAAREEELEKLCVRAPYEGHVKIFATKGQKIAENTLVAKITAKPAPTATFKMAKNAVLERGLSVPLKVGEKMYTCEVADSSVDGTRVVCRMQAEDLKDGDEAKLLVEQER